MPMQAIKKKLIFPLVIMMIFMTMGLVLQPANAQDTPGDVNNDGTINTADITLTERIVVGLDSPNPLADANQDGKIDTADITTIEILIWQSDPPTTNPVLIPDANLEAAIRSSLNKPTGEITADDMATIKGLRINYQDIHDLTGLEYCVNLDTLWVRNNTDDGITDLSPIAGLTNMRELDISFNPISDLSPVAGLTKLTYFWAGWCHITDISPLVNCTKITFLGVENQFYSFSNPSYQTITNIDVVANMPNLEKLWVAHCKISDISCLAGLYNLGFVDLWSNTDITDSDITVFADKLKLYKLFLTNCNINDASPIINNAAAGGLGVGDYVDLSGNPIQQENHPNYYQLATLDSYGIGLAFYNLPGYCPG